MSRNSKWKMKFNFHYFRLVTRLAGWQPAAGKRSYFSHHRLPPFTCPPPRSCHRLCLRPLPHSVPHPRPVSHPGQHALILFLIFILVPIPIQFFIFIFFQVWGHPQAAPRAHGEPGIWRGAKGEKLIQQTSKYQRPHVYFHGSGAWVGRGARNCSQAQHVWSQVDFFAQFWLDNNFLGGRWPGPVGRALTENGQQIQQTAKANPGLRFMYKTPKIEIGWIEFIVSLFDQLMLVKSGGD